MAFEKYSDDIIVASLPPEPETVDEINAITGAAIEGNCSVAISLKDIDIIKASSISRLLRLMKRLSPGRKMVLYDVLPAVKGVFAITALDGIFTVVDHLDDAIEKIRE